MDNLVLLERQDPEERPEKPEKEANRVEVVQKVQLVLLGCLDVMDVMVPGDQLANKDPLVVSGNLAPSVKMVQKELKELRESRVNAALRESWAHQVQPVIPEPEEIPVSRAHRVLSEHQESRASPVEPDQVDHQESAARPEKPAFSAIQEHQESQG